MPASFAFLLLIFSLRAPPGDAQAQVLPAGRFVELRVEADSPIVTPAELSDAWSEHFPHRGITLRFLPEANGLHYLEVRTHHIVPQVVVHDSVGETIVERGDVRVGVIELDLPALTAGAEIEIVVISRYGLPGPFSLRVSERYPPDYVPTPEIEWTRAFLEHGPAAVEADGADPLSLALALHRQASFQAGFGDPAAALELALRACALAESRPDHPLAFEILTWPSWLLTQTGRHAEGERLNRIALEAAEPMLDREHALFAAPLANLATCLSEQGRYAEGLPLLERSIAIHERSGGERATLRTMLENLAYLHLYLEQNAAAERAMARALELAGADEATSRAALARLLNIGALFDARVARYEAALEKLERACALGEDDADRRNYQNSLNQRGDALIRLGRLREAEEVLRQASRLCAEPRAERSDACAITEYNLADACRLLGRYEESRERFERALTLMQEVLGPRHPFMAGCLDGLGKLLDDIGLYAEAATRYRHAHELYLATLGSDHSSTAMCLGNLAGVLEALGEYTEARRSREQSIDDLRTSLGERHPETLVARSSYASLLNELGDHEQAYLESAEVLELFRQELGERHPHTLSAANSLGCTATYLRRMDEAVEILRRVIEQTENEESRATYEGNLGRALAARGELDEALQCYRRSLATVERSVGADNIEATQARQNLAQLLSATGHSETALALFEQNLTVRAAQLGSRHPRVAEVLQDLALVQADLGSWQEARSSARRAFMICCEHLASSRTFLSEGERFALAEAQLGTLEVLLGLCFAHPDPVAEREARRAVLAWKGQISRELVASKERLRADLDEEARARLERLRDVQAQLSTEVLRREVPDPALHEERLGRLRRERSELERDLAARGEGAPALVDLEVLRAALPPGSALVDLFVHEVVRPLERDSEGVVRAGYFREPEVTAWITRPERAESVRVSLGSAASIEGALPQHLTELARPRGEPVRPTDGARAAAGEELRRLLWDPLAPHLEGVRLVIVSPDSFLATVPFEALTLPDGTHLVEHHAFAYLQDALSLLEIAREPSPARDALVCVGAVDYGERAAPSPEVARLEGPRRRGGARETWAPLPGTAGEIDLMEAAFRASHAGARVTRLAGADATEEALKLALPGAGVVHLATHGFFQSAGAPSMWERARAPDEPFAPFDERRIVTGQLPGLLSGLVCAGANLPVAEERDDGLLTAEEITWLDLAGCELVVLSACETALGEARSGEGLASLRRAFRLAGARTVIGSLWSVDDESTARLMRSFYERLWSRGETKLEALRGAQLEMLAENRRLHGGQSLPYTWAAFVLYGGWN